jgi:hypothetical protein
MAVLLPAASETGDGLMVMLLTVAASTVTLALPLTPARVAVIVALPFAREATCPAVADAFETLTRLASLDDQITAEVISSVTPPA